MGMAMKLFPDFFLAYWTTFVEYIIWGTSRSLLTKSVEPEEIGKVQTLF